MRSPTRALAGHLRWTRSGTVWADWLLRPLPYGYRPVKDKRSVRGLHQALFRALPGESLLLGVCAGLDPAAVVERMMTGVDLQACPDWAAECEATLDTLDAIGPGQRLFWLSVPLGSGRGTDRVLDPFRSAAADLRDSLALPRAGIPAGELTRRLEQARQVAAAIPAVFAPRPATAAQMVWLHLHAQQRGLFADLDLPDSTGTPDLTGRLLTPRTGAALPDPLLDEGGQADLGWRDRTAGLHSRRYLKVTQPGSPHATAASYQSLLVLSDVPPDGMLFPGSEFLGRIDESGLEVDWALRLHVRSKDQVAAQNRKALINLNEQYGQREGELSHGLGVLDRAAADLQEYVRALESDKLEVEVQATAVFAVAAPDPAGALDQARSLADYLGGPGYKVLQPLGYQEDLWWAMQPGVPASRAVREFAQITTSKALAAAVPLASTELGDSTGSLLGWNITSGRPGVVLHDIAGASVRDVSGSLAIAGELGAGKALALSTPIPTPAGWTAMGDLTAGDRVFDEHGAPTVVLAVSPVLSGRVCYRVLFDDGSTVTADAEHLWSVLPAGQPAGPGWAARAVTVSTERLQALLAAGAPLQIPAAGALTLPAARLPVDPYALGVRLGAAARRSMSCSRPAGPAPAAAGGAVALAVRARPAADRGRQPAAGLPRLYLRADVGQRRALLAGLLDTAGALGAGGTVTVPGVRGRFADDLAELIRTLGYRPERHPLGGVSFHTRDPVFRLSGKRSTHAQHAAALPAAAGGTGFRRVLQVDPVPSVPVRCIRVAAASRLFLAGTGMVPTHNSLTLKSQAGAVVDRGGRVIVADRTAMGEYVAWARSVTAATVVDVNDPAVSLDPLRLFTASAGSRVTQSFLTPLLNVAPTSERGVLLSDVLDPRYLTEHGITGLGGLLTHLKTGCELAGAAELARTMNVFARRDFGRVIFDESLPPLPLTTPAVVIRTHTLELPSRAELEHQHLFAQLRLEKIFGRAMYALIAALARQICFTDRSVLGLFVVDEAHHVTSSPEGEREIADFVRDGRKHRAAVALGSHDPEEDFGSPTLRGLIPTRILMRHRDKTLAKRGLAWLGLDPEDDELVSMLTEDTSPVGPHGVPEHRRGEALIMDSSSNVGRLKVQAPSLPGRNAAVRTSPPELATPAAPPGDG